eukprot:gene14071-2167_t
MPLMSNRLEGPMGSLLQLSAVHTMYLQANNFRSVPPALPAIPALRYLDLSDNPLNASHLSAGGALQVLRMRNSSLQGPAASFLPPQAGKLSIVDMSDNRLTGPVPAWAVATGPAAPDTRWWLANVSEDCHTTCSKVDRLCTETEWPRSRYDFDSILREHTNWQDGLCRGWPVLHDKGPVVRHNE